MAESDDGGDASTSFVRQRRDLFVVSTVLLLFQFAHVEVLELNFFGSKIDTKEVGHFTIAVWALWAYWLWRLRQSIAELPFPNGIQRFYMVRWARYHHATHKLLTGEAASFKEQWLAKRPHFDPQAVECVVGTEGHVADRLLTLAIRPSPLQPLTPEYDASSRKIVKVSRWRLIWPWLRSAVSSAADSFLFTEYVFPFIYAMTPLGYLGWRHAPSLASWIHYTYLRYVPW